MMVIGSVKEMKQNEYRVGLTPGNVAAYRTAGHTVFIEQKAGLGAGFSDEDYIAAGATMADATAIWRTCDMVVKVKEPLPQEVAQLQNGQILYTYLHLAADETLTRGLLDKKVTAMAYETITDPDGTLPLLHPMSDIAGRLSIQAGARCLEKHMGGRGLLLGGVPGVQRANVVIIGGGIVGRGAAKMAMGLGANVTVLDNNLRTLAYLDDLFGQNLQTLYSTPEAIANALTSADLVIGAVLRPGAAAPKLIRRAHLSIMKPGSVIVDVAVDQGGCCETTRPTHHNNPTFVVDGIIHYCVANMPGAVAETSTMALTNATLPFGLAIANKGLKQAARENPGILHGINCYDGHVTYRAVADEFGLVYQDFLGIG